jgi:hypothetical protein
VQEVTDSEAAALTVADNLRVGPSPRGADDSGFPAVESTIATHLASIAKCADMCSDGGGLQRQTLDLLKAHAWRAARLMDARNLIVDEPCAPPRERSIASILDEVVEGFATECRLSGITIRADVREPLSSAGLHDNQLAAGVCGALLAVLPLVEHAVSPSIVIKASTSNSQAVAVDVVQTSTPIAQHVADSFFTADRRGDEAAKIGALAAKALADAHDGLATFETLPHGSRLTILMKRRS